MKITTKILVAALSLTAGIAQASTIQIGTGVSNAGSQVDAATYKSVVDAAITNTAPVLSYDNVTPQVLPGIVTGTGPFAFESTINFGVSSAAAGIWQIRAGVDFGHGGAIFVDGVAKDFKTNDMWWNGSYSDTTQSFQLSLDLGAGNHVLQLYGLEGCCSGALQTQYQFGNNPFTSFSSTDGLIAAVPEPETCAMLLAGLALMGAVARRRKAKQA